MPEQAETVEVVELDALQLDPSNARLHTDESQFLVNESLLEFGPARSIVIDEQGVVRAGNGTLTQARKIRDINKVKVVDADEHTLVAVRRKGLSDEEWTRYAIADNASSDASDWDVEVLQQLSLKTDLAPFMDEEAIANLQIDGIDDEYGDGANGGGDGDRGSSAEFQGEADRQNLYPLAIMLPFPDYQRWKEIKEMVGETNDTKALLALMKEFAG